MKNLKIASAIEWHDGVLLETKIDSNKGLNITLLAEVYKDQSSKLREKLKIQFLKVESLIITADAEELMDNQTAGNISNGYIKPCKAKDRHKFFLYLNDGLISLNFSNVVVEMEV